MVVFTCDACGTSLKKSQVERHFGCSRNVSCMDCQKVFCGGEYKAHTKCISEEEKYNGPDWKAPSSRNKGERKQAAWVETVNSVLETGRKSMSPKQVALFKMIAERDNVPKKKTKFLNFVSNVAKNGFDLGTVEAVWDLLVAELKKPPTVDKETTNGGSAETGDNVKKQEIETSQEDAEEDKSESKKKKSKKSKRKKEQDTEAEEIGTAQDGRENDFKNEDDIIGKSKKKKRKTDNDKVEVNETVPENCAENIADESKKGKSKKNKRKKEKVEEIAQEIGDDEVKSESKIKKVKKNKQKQEKEMEPEIDVKKSKTC